MRFGLHATLLIAMLVVMGWASGELAAQSAAGSGYPPAQFYPPADRSASASHPVQALFLNPTGFGSSNSYVDAHGNPIVVPASYYDGGPGGYPPGYPPADCGCAVPNPGYPMPPVYGGHCQSCNMGSYPPFEDHPGQYTPETYSLLPPRRTEQCGPHYFDVRMEAVFLTRDETFRQQVDFTSLNVDGPIMLRSGDLDFETEPGFRILGRYDIGALSVLEFGYTGLENLDARASFTDPNPVDVGTGTGNVYSLFTNFVRDPMVLPNDVTDPGGSFPGTERSITHSISLESELHIAEMNVRRYWVGFNPAVSGTMLAGFRFVRLREDFQFATIGEANGAYLESIKNDLAGFQTGGDVWVHLLQGLRAGVEGKVGLFNNHYTLDNGFTVTGLNQEGAFNEHFEKDIPALVVDASADVIWDFNPSWSVRAGYEILFINSILLAGENFNTATIYGDDPDVVLPARVPYVNDQGDAFYHGFHVGAEYIW